VLVVSTEHPDPLDQFIRLGQAQHALQHQSAPSLTLPKHAAQPKWFSTNIFKYHVLVHDVSTGDDAKAESIFQSMKMSYGTHSCHLLRLNSSLEPDFQFQSSSPLEATPLCDPWAGILRFRLRHFDSIRYFQDESVDGEEKLLQNSKIDLSTLNNTSRGAENGFIGSSPAAFSLDNDEDESNVRKTTTTTIATPILAPKSSGECIPHPLSNASLNRLVEYDVIASDLDRLKIFVQEFCLRGLLPFVERQLRLLSDQ
uniref:Uncharacterized protein n=1 Tax=Romanomermis culicivorax TaxID=13658 RepID=A0A915JBG2_ROMCU